MSSFPCQSESWTFNSSAGTYGFPNYHTLAPAEAKSTAVVRGSLRGFAPRMSTEVVSVSAGFLASELTHHYVTLVARVERDTKG